jgi:multiple sugar transport system substrate-binding protein
MKHFFKNALILALVACVILCTSGCNSNLSTAQNAAAETGTPKITLSASYGGNNLTAFQNKLKQLNRKTTKYELDYDNINSYYNQSDLVSAFAAGKAPDLVMMYAPAIQIVDFVRNEYILDISGLIGRNRSLKLDNFFTSALDAVKYNGNYYGLPIDCNPYILVYNKDLFDKAHIAYPNGSWTWEDFKNAVIKFKKDTNGNGKIDQWGFNNNNPLQANAIISSYGGDLNHIESPECLKALQIFSEILHFSSSKANSLISESGSIFALPYGNVAMSTLIVTNDSANIPNYKFRYGVAVMPHGKYKCYDSFTKYFVINRKCKNQSAAFSALCDIVKSGFVGQMLPATKDAFTRTETNILSKYMDINVLEDMLNYHNSAITDSNLSKIFYEKVVTPIGVNDVKPEDAIKNMAKALGQ